MWHQPVIKKQINQWLVLAISLFLFGLTACGQPEAANQTSAQAIDGVLDLRQWDFEQNGVINLNGEWEFYWEQLLTNDDFAAATPPALTGFIKVPDSWRGYEVNGQPLTGDGYATYRLTVLIDPNALPEKFLALKMPVPVNTAHKLYVDGQLLGSAGQVGSTAETMTPQYAPYVTIFVPAGEQIEILLQISNFQHSRGGIIFDSIVFGPQTQVQQFNQQEAGRDLFLIGAILIMGLYHLGLFILRRREESALYFGLLCLIIVVRLLLTRQLPMLPQYFSQSWIIYMRTRVLLPVLGITSQALFVRALFPQEYPRWVLRLIFGVGAFLIGVILLASITVATALALSLALYVILVNLHIVGVAAKAAAHKRSGAVIFLVGYLPIIIATINDILFFYDIIQTGWLFPMGLFIFIFAQAYLLSVRFSTAFAQTEILSNELQRNNQSLQQAQVELRRSEAKYRSLFEDSRDVIFITTLDGRIEAINPACFDLLGYTSDEVLTMNALDFYVDPDDRPRVQAIIAQTGAVTDFDVKMRHRNGHILECQLTATPRHDEAGQVTGYQGIIHNMTAYKQAEAARQRVLALQGLNHSLEQRVEARTTALSEASIALQAEIEQRQSHQQEKDRLLKLAQQQSEHLRSMSNWLVEMQQNQRQNQSTELDKDVRQKMADIRQNLSILHGTAVLEQDPGLITYVADTIRLLAEMEVYLEQVTTSMDESVISEDPLADNPLLQLSSRERQVLRLIAEGKSNPEIANIMTIRLNTVHTYLKRIRRKLDIQDIPGLIKFAQNNGLLD